MKKYALIIMLSLCCSAVFAQWGEEEPSDKPNWRDRVFVGGGLGGLSFSSYYDYFAINLLGGYKITPKLAGGVQLQYRFTNYKQTPKFKANDYGVSPFLRFNFYGPLFLHAEYEYLSYEYPINTQGDKSRKGYNSFMAGGGFFQPIGSRAGFYLMALYNFSYREGQGSDVSPYNSPFILRAGVTAGF